MDPIVNISIVESGMSIQTIEKEIAAQIRKHEAQLKHWRLVKAATAKLRSTRANGNGHSMSRGMDAVRARGKRTRPVKKAAAGRTIQQQHAWVAEHQKHARTAKKRPTPVKLGKLLAGAK